LSYGQYEYLTLALIDHSYPLSPIPFYPTSVSPATFVSHPEYGGTVPKKCWSYQTARCHDPVRHNMYLHYHTNLKSYIYAAEFFYKLESGKKSMTLIQHGTCALKVYIKYNKSGKVHITLWHACIIIVAVENQ